MIEDYLKNKYDGKLESLKIYENASSLILTRIVIKTDKRNEGIGTNIMNDIIHYADNHKQIIALTPSNDFGGDKNRLIQFYKKFGFKSNEGLYKNSNFEETMIRYPKLNENMKPKIKQLLRESLLTKEDKDVRVISDFVNFAKKCLGINDGIKIILAFERTPDLKTTAYYGVDRKFIKVYVKDRAIIDVCRSIAHELVHHKQNMEGRLIDTIKDGEDGSPIENEANAVAGVIIRKYGRKHPDIYK